MTEQRDKTISVRVSEEEKEIIQKLADKDEETLTGYIRGIVFPKEELNKDEPQSENEEEIKEQLNIKDKEIEEKNKEIAGLRKSLEEQQNLTLKNKYQNQELQKRIDSQTEKGKDLEMKEKKNEQHFSILLVLFLMAVGVIVFDSKK